MQTCELLLCNSVEVLSTDSHYRITMIMPCTLINLDPFSK